MKLAGEPLKVWEGTLEQIRSIDVGRWFGPELAGEPVPTLEDVLSMSRMMSTGVAGIITDEPGMARQVVEAPARMRPVDRLLLHAALLFGRPIPDKVYRDSSP